MCVPILKLSCFYFLSPFFARGENNTTRLSIYQRQLVFGGEYPDEDNLDLYQGGHCFSDLYDDFSQDYHVYALEWEENAFR